MKPTFFLFWFCLISTGFARKIQTIDDMHLVNYISTEDSVVVLFSKESCDKCDELEDTLEGIQDELRQSLGCELVKVLNSQMISIYNPSKEPSLIYFRSGIPLLYEGNINGDEITQLLVDNQEPVVKELSDFTFERLTQSTTGATTGDWFVMFYTTECVSCNRLFAIWEGVGAVLKRRINVARVNSHRDGGLTSGRFNVDKWPDFVFIRQGKYYRFKGKDLTIKGFVHFVDNLHTSKIKPETVPPIPVSGLRELVEPIVQLIVANRSYQLYAGAFVAIVVLIVLASLAMRSSQKPAVKTTDKKKKK